MVRLRSDSPLVSGSRDGHGAARFYSRSDLFSILGLSKTNKQVVYQADCWCSAGTAKYRQFVILTSLYAPQLALVLPDYPISPAVAYTHPPISH